MLISKDTLETHYSLARLLYFAAAPQHLALPKGQKANCVAAFSIADQLEPYLFAGSETHLRKYLLVFQSGQGINNPLQVQSQMCQAILHSKYYCLKQERQTPC